MIVRAIALVGAICTAVPAAAQQTVTKAEVRSQAPSATDSQLRNQLWRMFRKEDRRRKEAPKRPLDSVWLDTPAYPTAVQDLCRSDQVTIHLAPADPVKDYGDADTPMRAYGLDSFKRFLFLKLPPEKAPEERAEVRQDIWGGACSRLAQYDDRFFRAADEEMAEQGYRALLRAASAVQTGSVKPVCNLAVIEKRPCSEVLAAFAHAPISLIEACPAVAGLICYGISGSDDLLVRVSFVEDVNKYRPPNGSPLPAKSLVAVEVDQMIVFWESRPD